MSREVIIKVRDDLDGSDADETIEFTYRGVAYEIDLSSANVELYDKSLRPFVEAARKVVAVKPVSAAPARARKAAPPPDRVLLAQRKAIRAWANDNGFKVDQRGMIAATVVEAYSLAHPDEKLLPGVWPSSPRRGGAPVVERVTAQQADQDGLISAATLLGQYHGGVARDREGEQKLTLDKEQSDAIRQWARRHGSSGTARDRDGEKLGKAQRDKIRKWANENGFEQAASGMLKQEVLEAYFAAHEQEGAHGN